MLCNSTVEIKLFYRFFFSLGFLLQPFTNHRTAGEGGEYFFNSSLPLPTASQTLRYQPGDYCREFTSAHRQQPDSNPKPLVFSHKSLSTKLRNPPTLRFFGTVSSRCSFGKKNCKCRELWKSVIDLRYSRALFKRSSLLNLYVVMAKMLLAVQVHLFGKLLFWRGNNFLDTSILFFSPIRKDKFEL